MQIPKLAKNMLNVLPVLAVAAATVIGLFLGRALYPPSLASQSNETAQVQLEPNLPPPPIVLGAVGPCGSSNLYTSLPPKCKNTDGSFRQADGTSPFVITLPEESK